MAATNQQVRDTYCGRGVCWHTVHPDALEQVPVASSTWLKPCINVSQHVRQGPIAIPAVCTVVWADRGGVRWCSHWQEGGHWLLVVAVVGWVGGSGSVGVGD